jgi:UDP-N-acetylmuramoyl-tripeptide--D-alanyl-D-alanine ligase
MFLDRAEVAAALGLPLNGNNAEFTGVSTDTRSLLPGCLFVALVGDRFDGHDYLEDAFAKGARAAIVSKDVKSGISNRLLVVDDTLTAYGKVAAAWRRKFDIPVIAVTGSVGKTTMKEMVSLVVSPLGPVLKSERNENNEVGVPQTLLRLNSEHKAAIVEMGMRGLGQIKYLSDVAQPTVGVITIIGESHIELVGSKYGIADAKGELLESLPSDGIAVLNSDDPFFKYLAQKSSAKVLTYGESPLSDVAVLSAEQEAESWHVQLKIRDENIVLHLHSPARHDVFNAAGSLAVAVAIGVSPSSAAKALEAYRPGEMRMQMLHASCGAAIINDCYNAAPSSVVSALRTLANLPVKGERIAFLGDMRELGDYSLNLHLDVASAAVQFGIESVYTVGDFTARAFPNAIRHFGDSNEAAQFVSSELRITDQDAILVKGSRALQLEKVVEALVLL